MRTIFAGLVFCYALVAQADEVVSIEWEVIGIQDSQANLLGGVRSVEAVRVDTRWGTFGTVNGVIVLDGNYWLAATGTCFALVGNQMACELSVRGVNYNLTVDLGTGGGEISISDEDGFAVEDGAIVLTSIQ